MPCSTLEEQRRYQREWVARRRAAYFATKKCAVCGSRENLSLHHKDPARKISHNIWSWTEARRKAELAQCEVLCVDCHRRIHARVKRALASVKFPCGTDAAYKRGCRCYDCTLAHRDAGRRWKQQRWDAA